MACRAREPKMEEDENRITQADAAQAQSPEQEQEDRPAAEADRSKAQSVSDSETLDDNGDELFVEMSEEEKKLAEANERYVRLMADFDNYRKRVRKERELLRNSANEEIVCHLIPVIDNLERAIAAGRNGESGSDSAVSSVLKGVELTLKLFANLLSRHGVERITCLGEKFDPTRHEAVAQVDVQEVEPETIVEEVLPGYLMNGRVIRAAKVNVAKAAPATDNPAGDE